MLEKLIENWLINANEKSYQIPFCEVLITHGYSIISVSSHGPGERGKDVIARATDGMLYAFQLKGGNIGTNEWRRIRGEVEDLVRIPVNYPGIHDEPHIPVLVTNGTITQDAQDSIDDYSTMWQKDGSYALETIQMYSLLRSFIDAHGSYLPTELSDFREFIELYVADFNDRLPRKKFASFLQSQVSPKRMGGAETQKRRAIQSTVLLSSYIVERYENAGNHVSSLEGWTIVASTILHLAERENLLYDSYEPSLNLVWEAFKSNTESLRSEVSETEHFVSFKDVFAEPFVHNARVTLILGWLAAIHLLDYFLNLDLHDKEPLFDIFMREFPNIGICGEADWPRFALIALFIIKERTTSEGTSLLDHWIKTIVNSKLENSPSDLPSPYWLQDDALALRTGQIPIAKHENFSHHSYTTMPAMDILVRRWKKQKVSLLWPDVSRIHYCEFTPQNEEDWFQWTCKDGKIKLIDLPLQASWTNWLDEATSDYQDQVPEKLVKHPEWAFPFALTYPHRMNRILSGYVDMLVRRGHPER